MHRKFSLDRDELATRLGGGLPQGSLCIIEGESGSGKSVLAQRLTYGLLKNDNRVAYVTTEFTTPAFMEQMEQLGYPALNHFVAGDLLFVPTIPIMGHPVRVNELLPRLLGAKRLVTQPVVVVDTFSRLAEPHLEPGAHGEEVLEHLVRALKQINAAGTTLVLTVDPDHLEGVPTSALTSAADIRLQCSVERVGNQVNRFIVAKKFARAANMVGDVIPFRVEPGVGFIVEIKAVA